MEEEEVPEASNVELSGCPVYTTDDQKDSRAQRSVLFALERRQEKLEVQRVLLYWLS